MNDAANKATVATESELRIAEGRGKESAMADHLDGTARWPYGNSAFGLSARQGEIQGVWARAKREALTSLGHRS